MTQRFTLAPILALLLCSAAFSQQPWTPYQYWQPGDVHLSLPPGAANPTTGQAAGNVRHAVVYGYAFIYNNNLIFGNCSYKIVGVCSGRGCRPPVTDHPTMCVWDLNGTVLWSSPGAFTPAATVSDFTYPLCNFGDPQPCRYPPGYGISEVITFATNGTNDTGGNVTYGNTYYDVTGFIHPSMPAPAPPPVDPPPPTDPPADPPPADPAP